MILDPFGPPPHRSHLEPIRAAVAAAAGTVLAACRRLGLAR